MAAFLCFLVLTIASNVLAHMQLYYPAPFNASNNPHKTTAADPFLVFPYNCCGEGARWEYPCRGYHSLLGTPDGAPTATWAAGSQQHWSIAGTESPLGGNHYGGSCQVGFSVDHGETFHVATSYEGNYPHRDGGIEPENQDFLFTVPHDLAPGIQLFAWIWYNRETEYNMNCAAVEITAGNGSTPSQSAPGSYGQGTSTATASPTTPASSESGPDFYGQGSPTTTAGRSSSTPTTYKTANGLSCVCEDPKDISTCNCDCASQSSNHAKRKEQARNQLRDTIPFSSRPLMLVADEGNGCKTPKTHAELKFPDPGPDVVTGDGVYPLQLPEGNCAGGGK